MSIIDIESILSEVVGDEPCGKDLEYDPDFISFETKVVGKPEQRIGDSYIPPEPPNWREVQQDAIALLNRTKDLRVAVHLTKALLNTTGFEGMSDGLAVVRGLIERYWDNFHPRLDPDDDNDPTMRVNILASLCDASSFVQVIRDTDIVNSRALGRFSLRDIDIAMGALSAQSDDDRTIDMATVDAAFMDADLDAVRSDFEAISQCHEHITQIDTYVTEKVGASGAMNLDELTSMFKHARQFIAERLARRGERDAVSGEAAGTDVMGSESDSATEAAVVSSVATAVPGKINSREDAMKALDRVCDYYTRCEPSSPVPLLLRRAKRLATKDFMGILRDMLPDGLSDASKIVGSEED